MISFEENFQPAFRPAWRNVASARSGGIGKARIIAALGDSISRQALYDYRVTLGAASSQTIAYAMPGYEATARYAQVVSGINTPLSVSVAGSDVTVNLATNGSGVATSTAAQVAAAVKADAAAWARMRVYAPTGGGAGVAVAGALAYGTAVVSSFPSFLTTAQWLLRGRFELARRLTIHDDVAVTAGATPGNYDFGYAGYRADQLAANPGPLGDVLASNADTVLVMAGANDTVQDTAEVLASEVIAIWDAVRAAGKRVIATQVTWNSDSAKQAKIVVANPILEAAAALRGIPFWKHEGITGTANYTDGVHPGLLGGHRLGQSLAAFLASRAGSQEFVFPEANDARWITANPYMTGGTTTATSWTPGTNPSGGTCVMSKVGDWQQAVISQPPAAYNANWVTFQNSVSFAGKAVVGDTVRACADVEMDFGADYKNLVMTMTFNPSRGTAAANANGGTGNINAMTTGVDPLAGIVLSQPCVIPAGCTDVSISFQFYGSGTIRLRKAGIYKV